MDQTVQQNAAMVEQSTAASHALKGEANGLMQMIRRFQVSGASAAVGSTTSRRDRPGDPGVPSGPAPGRRPGHRRQPARRQSGPRGPG